MPLDLTLELRRIAVEALNAYLQAPPLQNSRTPIEEEAELDRKRAQLIENALKPLLTDYLGQSLSTADFKRQIDSVNKQNPLWGFSGIKGQMFFNMLVKTADDGSELDDQLRSAIQQPGNEENAVTLLKKFKSYVTRIGQQFVDSGGDPHSKPKPSSVTFFLSYFWQIHRPDLWPVYYTNTIQMIEDMNLWQETGDIGEDYLTFKHLHEALVQLFSEAANRRFSLYDVEHVFWFKSGKLLGGTQTPIQAAITTSSATATRAVQASEQTVTSSDQASLLPDSYIPPIVAVIPRLAANDPALQEAARRSGTTLERAFEKSINAAFTMLGYETHLLGQGRGRVPDGEAIAVNESYALLWDAKARSDGYRMGTDDRTIRQYIDIQSKSLKRGRGIRNIYYLIISNGFADNFDDLIRSLKMETDVNEVCLVEAAALVEIVDQKLRAPLALSLGSDGIQVLFSSSGLISKSHVLDNLT